MTQKRLENGLWQFKLKGLVLIGTYTECQARLEIYSKMWGV